MVKVTGSAHGLRGLKEHLAYITRNGKLIGEREDGSLIEGGANVRSLAEEWWDQGGVDRPARARRHDQSDPLDAAGHRSASCGRGSQSLRTENLRRKLRLSARAPQPRRLILSVRRIRTRTSPSRPEAGRDNDWIHARQTCKRGARRSQPNCVSAVLWPKRRRGGCEA